MFVLLELCRLCTSNDNVSSNLYDLDSDNLTLSQKLNTIAPGILEPNNKLPNGVCTTCIANLHQAYKFINNCWQSQEIFKLHLKHAQTTENAGSSNANFESIYVKTEKESDNENETNPNSDSELNEFSSTNNDIVKVEVFDQLHEEKIFDVDQTIKTSEENIDEATNMTEQISDNNEGSINEHNLNIGQKFNDYEQLSTFVNAFCREHYHPFVIRTRSQKQVLYKCCHGVKQISKSQGKRPNQHYYYKSCPAQINFYRGKNEKWTLTKLLLNHNHTIGKEEYRDNTARQKRRNKNDYDTATALLFI